MKNTITPFCNSIGLWNCKNLFNRLIRMYTQRFNSLWCKAMIILTVIAVVPLHTNAQTPIPNEAEWNGLGYSLKKIVSNTTIQSGVNFSYTIMFSAPAGATTINITDDIPSGLQVVNVPPPANVNGVTPVVATTGTWPAAQTVSYSLTGLPAGTASSGSFTIVVKFPEGVTCDGTTARNRAGIIIDDKPYYTPFVSTTAQAVNPWKVQKSILSGPVVNPGGGSCGYLIEPGDTITYRLSVLKNSPYYGNVVGQQNMSSAVVTDVLPAGAVVVSSTCGIAAGSTGTITWNPNSGNLNAATPYAYYYCDVTVHYPSASFPVGSFIYNELTLDGMMCGQQVTDTSNETCIEVGNIIANPNGYFNKSIYLTNRVPGCQGYYRIAFCNTGNVDLTAFNINDVIPSGILVNQIKVFGGNTSPGVGTTMALLANSGANTIASSITTNYFDSGTIGFTVNDLQLQMTGVLPVGQCIYMYVYFEVAPNPTGTVVSNCADFDPLNNSLSIPQACVSFTVEEGEPHPCILKDVCSPQTEYEPGDIIRFRIRVQNIGSADISGATFQDNLHSNFTYLGNEAYYIANTYNPACSSGGGIPAGTTAWQGVSSGHSGNNLSWSLPDIPSDCQLFYVGYCGYYGTWGLPYYFIEFDVMVDSTALPGVTPNSYTISGGNLTGTSTSNTTYSLVVASFGQEVQKQVSTDGGSSYNSSGTVSPGGSATYRLNYKNTSNVPVSNVNLVDLLPMDAGSNDLLILNRLVNRGSAFGVTHNGGHITTLSSTGTPPTSSISYSNAVNACLPIFGYSPGGCAGPGWVPSAPGQNIKIDYASFVLSPNVTVREDFNVTIPANATVQQTACNDFAAISTAQFLLDGAPQSVTLTPIAAPPVCISVDTALSSSCCDSVRIEQVADPTSSDCCVRITTGCEVKGIQVTVNNGSIANASWNCGTIPSGYVGQSSFNFAAGGCAVDMTNCFQPDQAGVPITVYYDILFDNGEQCRDSIVVDCNPVDVNCCDSISLVAYQDADLGSCCIRVSAECEIDSVQITVTNGVFSSNNWNCSTPIPTGAIGQSTYMFDAVSCALNMTNCFTAAQQGMISVNYIFFFANGEKCEKGIELDCPVGQANCCDSISLEAYHDADLGECCVRVGTQCEVDSIQVSINNGVFSANNWNCSATIPGAAIGQSSYTFEAASCVLNMTNCIAASQTGTVSIGYVFYLANGEKCEKKIDMDCKASECCNNVKLEPVQSEAGCCVRLVTDCEVEAIELDVQNGAVSSLNWNCNAALPSAYAGQSNVTLSPNGCVVDLTTCVSSTSSSGVVSLTYIITFVNGEKCEKTIEIDCPMDNDPCCAEVDLKLKPKWPWWSNNLNGMFTINNIDPSVPICYVELAYSPATTMATGNLYIDGVLSTQTWTQTRIPATGNLSPSAVNSIKFNMVSSNYKGVVTVCVVKCDGTRCCFEFKWNKKPWGHTDIPIEEYSPAGKLVGISISPVLEIDEEVAVKYVSFGFVNEAQVNDDNMAFFAVSGSSFEGEESPSGLANSAASYMGKHSAFFELAQAVSVKENLGIFNMVFASGLPDLGCTLFDTEGNLIAGGEIDVSKVDTVVTAVIDLKSASARVFDFVNLYPNPSNGQFTITYVTSETMDIDILIVNHLGQVIQSRSEGTVAAGVHNTSIDVQGVPPGIYKTVLKSGNTILSKSAIIK